MPHFQDPETYRDILDALQIGVIVIDLHKKIIFWSDGAEQITGYSRLDVLGHSCSENILLHCNQSNCEACAGKCPMATALHDGKAVEALSQIRHISGHWTPVHTSAIPLRDEHGSIIAIIQTFENEFAVKGSGPNDRSLKERGSLDYTTELPNHAMTQSHLREMMASFTDLQVPFGVVGLEVLELTQFRARYGQEATTSILRVLARTLRNTIWPTDFVGRWSEDQFLVILSGCDQEALRAVSNRVLKIVARATIEWWGEELSVSVLIGAAAVAAGDTVESLLLRAQAALKANGALSSRATAGPGSSSKD
jgi:diguanylate cyclase (GGDEF)-like protein/PAS domain S-box-containing protein